MGNKCCGLLQMDGRHFRSVSINAWWISLTKLEYVFFIIGVKNNQQCGSKGRSVSICASRWSMCTCRWSDQSSACKQDNRLTRSPRWKIQKGNEGGCLVDEEATWKEKQWDRGVDADVEGWNGWRGEVGGWMWTNKMIGGEGVKSRCDSVWRASTSCLREKSGRINHSAVCSSRQGHIASILPFQF